MKFSLSEEQKLIQDSAEGFLSTCSDSKSVRTAMESDSGWQPELWQRVCQEMGWQSMHIPEEYGGLGLSYSSLAVVMEQTGRFLLCAPLFSSVCLATNALLAAHALGASAPIIAESLTKLASGEKTAAMGWMSPLGSTYNMSQSTLFARPTKDGYILEGKVAHVLHGLSADLLILAAKTDAPDKDNKTVLVVVDSDSDGLERVATPTMDQTRPKANFSLEKIHVPHEHVIADVEIGTHVLSQCLILAGIALAAEQAGVARQCLDMSTKYASERKQFGVPIGSFQSIQHRCADMFLKVESMRSAAWYAACTAQEYLEGAIEEAELKEVAAIAQSYCSEHCFACASDSIQIHGGSGFTWEFDTHLYFKRAQSNETLLGSSALHQEALAETIFSS
jgi:alkylation response protein AidB-like acyl-CoA dehydrogenase